MLLDLACLALASQSTKRLLPDTAIPKGVLSPVMKLALIVAPVVALYSPTVPVLRSATKRLLPDTAITVA